PLNSNGFVVTGQNESSISLQWNKVGNQSFILQVEGSVISVPAPDGNGPVTHTVSALSAGTEYTFTLFTVFNGVTSRGENLTAATAPLNSNGFVVTGQNESSISLQWNKVGNQSFILQVEGSVINVPAPDGNGPVTHTVSALSAGTEYTFTLFTVFNGVPSRGENLTAATAPLNSNGFVVTGQNESSISLQWNKVGNQSFILQVEALPAPDGNGPVTHTVSALSAGTEYTFTLFTVFNGVTSSGATVRASTAPLNSNGFVVTGQNESSISLQWNKVGNQSFILQVEGSVISVPAPDGNGPVDPHSLCSLCWD
uniref:Fibronectin type-III domain-containing protein n=1 Tax=Tetraodon nigroviridis TaxID=99883 RepID=H3CNJ4_TETNG